MFGQFQGKPRKGEKQMNARWSITTRYLGHKSQQTFMVTLFIPYQTSPVPSKLGEEITPT